MAIRISRLARADLDDIRVYTRKQWGEAQWYRYYRDLVDAFSRIADDPTVGRSRDLLRPGMRSVTCGKHVIFFAPVAAAGGAPVILRIVHERRNLPALAYYDHLDG